MSSLFKIHPASAGCACLYDYNIIQPCVLKYSADKVPAASRRRCVDIRYACTK